MDKKWQTILLVGAEGGSLSIKGYTNQEGIWTFVIARNETTIQDLLEDISDEEARSEITLENWQEALLKMDKYPWAKLYPREVHDKFKLAVWEAVKERTSDVQHLEKWAEVCE